MLKKKKLAIKNKVKNHRIKKLLKKIFLIRLFINKNLLIKPHLRRFFKKMYLMETPFISKNQFNKFNHWMKICYRGVIKDF